MPTNNIEKKPPKGKIKFNITLSDEQKEAKSNVLFHPFNFLTGKAGSGKTLLAVQGSLNEKMEPWLVPIRSNMRKVYNKPDILEKMEKDEHIELVSLAHFRGRTFDHAAVIVDEFQNLTKPQLGMVLGRLGKDSTMILTGDPQQIDLKFANDSAIHEVPKLKNSDYVYTKALLDNHRHEALSEILKLLYDEYSHGY